MFYAMTVAPILFYDVIEEVWNTIVYNTKDKVITLTSKVISTLLMVMY